MEQHSFQEVMKQWNRMCGKQGHCCTCPADGLCSPVSDLCTDMETMTALEGAIMRWAEEHPEPVYPTWFEWLEQEGVTGREYEHDPYFIGDKEIYMRTAALTPKAFEPIPADIAQKLGLKPKEE